MNEMTGSQRDAILMTSHSRTRSLGTVVLDETRTPANVNLRRPSWTPSLQSGYDYTGPAPNSQWQRGLPANSGGRRSQKSSPLMSSKLALPPTDPDSDSDSGFVPPSAEMLSGRRPSWTPSLPRKRVSEDTSDDGPGDTGGSSSEAGKTLTKALQIDMKGLVGEALGNMSIAPTSRDVVLGARRGLFIIDLEAPLEVPRFLAQGGTWDAVELQWSPHPSRAEYIISTSAEKVLVWNLNSQVSTAPPGLNSASTGSAIQHILHAHYRAITDINWAPNELDILCSTGLDSWLWCWDLRTGVKPVWGLSAFTAAGTQVKWNRVDPNILASSHGHEVLVWDRRKGSIPLKRLHAHHSRIYGLDWSHESKDEIITCSLDRSIKLYNTNDPCSHPMADWNNSHSWPSVDLSSSPHLCKPRATIHTNYPVWRARNVPFGKGVLSLPQRGETSLELFSLNHLPLRSPVAIEANHEPVEVFYGHSDVVKEFVWRKGRGDSTDFQLITWSKDRTLRFWPVETDAMLRIGYDPNQTAYDQSPIGFPESNSPTFSFRNPPSMTETHAGGVALGDRQAFSSLSVPIGTRAILAEVRAKLPPEQQQSDRPRLRQPLLQLPNLSSPAPGKDAPSSNIHFASSPVPSISLSKRRGTMSRGNTSGKGLAQMEPLNWLSSVKVGKKGSKSNSGSRDGDSCNRELESSETRGDVTGRISTQRKRRTSPSRTRNMAEGAPVERSLQDEITSVLNRLAIFKVRLEKHDLTKKRSCTLSLHGPWGRGAAVFLRVNFIFPKEYPHGSHPEGTPVVDIERNPLISMKDRAFVLRRLRIICERRPCLEACLRFLLFASEEEDDSSAPAFGLDDDELSSDEEDIAKRKAREITVALLRNNKNLAEPRTSQGTFGPNGELVCFFRAPPRIVKSAMRSVSNGSSIAPSPPVVENLKVSQPPSSVTDAIRLLGLSSMDGSKRPPSAPRRSGDDTEVTMANVMSNLMTFKPPHLQLNRGKRSPDGRLNEETENDENDKNYALVPSRRSTVFITNTIGITGADRRVAVDYAFRQSNLRTMCETNALFARSHGRYDHERIFYSLATLFPPVTENMDPMATSQETKGLTSLLTNSIYKELSQERDIQMLAMLSSIILQNVEQLSFHHGNAALKNANSSKGRTATSSAASPDYFSIPRPHSARMAPQSPPWSQSPSSPNLIPNNPLSTSNSSRGSWSSLFNAVPMRQFMSSVQEMQKDNTASSETSIGVAIPKTNVSALKRGSVGLQRGHSHKEDPTSPSLPFGIVSKSWQEASLISTRPAKTTFVSRASWSRGNTPSTPKLTKTGAQSERRLILSDMTNFNRPTSFIDDDFKKQLTCHIVLYAEILFRWHLNHKRLELLKVIPDVTSSGHDYELGLSKACSRCGSVLANDCDPCSTCSKPLRLSSCSICRLPVKGLSRSCMRCYHVSHVSCWRVLGVQMCPTGCGCFCTSDDEPEISYHNNRSPRFVFSNLP